jgi:hypothetical protein
VLRRFFLLFYELFSYGASNRCFILCSLLKSTSELTLGVGGGAKSTITEATTDPLYQPRMMMSVEQSVEYLARETEVL